MQLEKLFQMQKELDEHIEAEHPREVGEDRLAKKILALQVELGELANEWRGFKFWSNDQTPRTFERNHCPDCLEKGYNRGHPPKDDKKGIHGLGNHWYYCEKCKGFLVVDKNPLLEEYVDCLHFTLSIGNNIDFQPKYTFGIVPDNVLEQFNDLFSIVSDLYRHHQTKSESDVVRKAYLHQYFDDLLINLTNLGKLLGFTDQQIEQAYIAKNQVNRERQENGY